MEYNGRLNLDYVTTTDHPYARFQLGDFKIIWKEASTPTKPVEQVMSKKHAYSLFGPSLDSIAAMQNNNYRTAINISPDDFVDTFYPIIFSYDGTFLPVPEPLKSKFPDVRVNNQPRYAEAKRTGEIIVSDYQAGHVRVEFEPGEIRRAMGTSYTYYITLWKVLGLTHNPTLQNPIQIGGYLVTGLPVCTIQRQYGYARETLADTSFDMYAFQDSVLAGLPPFDDIVTKVVASANSGSVDLATSLAELPKTAESILRGCSLLLSMYKDAKAKNFRLQDQIKKVRFEWDRELSKEENRRNRGGIKHLNKVKQFEKTTNNLLHEVSSVWLTYRLEVIPLAATIESSIDGLVLGDAFASYVRFREHGRGLIPWNGVDIPVEFRAFVKRALHTGTEWQSFFSVNLTKTAWELVTLSFVVDRYMAIGDWISANLSRPSEYTLYEGATKSWSIDSTFRVPGKRITVVLKKRQVFSSDDYCPLYFPSSRTNDQRLDHLALAWSILTKRL